MINQHPLAYLLAVEGAALVRAFAGEHDRDFTLARIAAVRAFVEGADAWGDGVTLSSVTTPNGYRTAYPVPRRVAPPCRRRRQRAGDARPSCRGRSGRQLCRADLHELPIPDHAVDVIVCALALTHVPDLGAALTEFVRVLRPGGHLVICLELKVLVDGLGFVSGRFCPHHDAEDGRKPLFRRAILDGTLPPGYAAYNRVALHFDGTELVGAVRSEKCGKALRVVNDGGTIVEEEIPTRFLGTGDEARAPAT